MSLPTLLRNAIIDESGLSVSIAPEWLQGRTAYGGLSAALALVAVKQHFPDLPPLRSAQIAFVGPLAGDVHAMPVLLRRGRNSAFVSCDITSGDGVGLRALFLFMNPRGSSIAHESLITPTIADPVGNRIDSAKLPQGFLTNFDLSRWEQGEAGFLRWVRLKDRENLDPAVELIAVADALPPAAMALSATWGPVSTTTWQINLIADAPATRDGWWLLEATALHAGDGSSSQQMTIWNRDGLLIATATQSVALFL